MRLHIKLALLIVVFCVVIGGTIALLVSNVMDDALEKELEKRGVVIAQTLAEHVTHSVIDGEVVAAREVLQEIVQRTEDVEFAYVVGFDGSVFAHSFEDGFPRALLSYEYDLIRADSPHLEGYSTREGPGLMVGYPLIDGMKAHLHVGLSETYLHDQVESTRNQIVVATSIVALLAASFGIVLSHSIARPLEQLSESLRAFGERRVEREIEFRGGGREVADLTRSFNWMITERKRAEEALRETRDYLENLINYANAPIVVWDPEGRITRFNHAFEHLTGYKADEVIGQEFSMLVPEASRDESLSRIERTLSGEYWESVEIPILRQDGDIRLALWNSANIYAEDGTTLLATIAQGQDITERKRAEEALKEYSEHLEEMVEQRTQELRDAQEELIRKEKLAVLGQLAGGVGHELRNPLGVISNAVYFLQMTLPDADETTATAREYLEIISEEVRNSTKIISDLLDFSRTRMPEREEIAVSELVAEVLEKRPPPEEVEVITELAPDLPPVYVDPRQMGQVLVNLVVNAYQAMKEGGALTISAQTSEVSEKLPKSGWVSLSVADTGCGIPEENMAKLFEPLFTTKARGIGLGLAVSRILVEANGGSMEVESPSTRLRAGEEGKGSTFTVRLPTREVVA